jgi:prepilin-type N-terminal cleavage/methylation domain-containing protein
LGFKKQQGFTLIEILIAVIILAFMATMTGSSISRSLKLKAKLDKEIEDDSQLREVVALMTKDINLAFHWSDPQSILKQQIIQEALVKNKPNPYPNFDKQEFIPNEKLTAFMGEASAVYFTTLSNERQFKNSQESDQAEVAYYLKDMRSLKEKKMTKTLVRRISPILDGDVMQGGKETNLLENIKSLKFRYLSEESKDLSENSWLESWKSQDTIDIKMRNKFPAAVEVPFWFSSVFTVCLVLSADSE